MSDCNLSASLLGDIREGDARNDAVLPLTRPLPLPRPPTPSPCPPLTLPFPFPHR